MYGEPTRDQTFCWVLTESDGDLQGASIIELKIQKHLCPHLLCTAAGQRKLWGIFWLESAVVLWSEKQSCWPYLSATLWMGTVPLGFHLLIYKLVGQSGKFIHYLMQPQWKVSRLALQGVLLLNSSPAIRIHKGSLTPRERTWGETAYLGTWEAKQIVWNELKHKSLDPLHTIPSLQDNGRKLANRTLGYRAELSLTAGPKAGTEPPLAAIGPACSLSHQACMCGCVTGTGTSCWVPCRHRLSHNLCSMESPKCLGSDISCIQTWLCHSYWVTHSC